VHLNQFRAISVPSVKSRIQRSHRVTPARSENGVDPRAMIQENLARIQVAVQSRDMKRRLAVVRSNVQRARSSLRQPLDQLDSAGRDGLVSDSRTSDSSNVERTAVLRQNL